MDIKIMDAVLTDIREAFKAHTVTITPESVHPDYTKMLLDVISMHDLVLKYGHEWVKNQQDLFTQIAEELRCDITA